MTSSNSYRPSVVGVFINSKKDVLVALRSDTKTWQFPQGGIEKGEKAEDALYREMKEEIGSSEFKILKKADTLLRYDFPKGFKGSFALDFLGQEQHWFLCEFKNGFGPDLSQSTCDEFLDTKWVEPQEILNTIVEWKKDTYQKGLSLLNLL